MSDVDTPSGSISPGGRFDRMEASLSRIELKLDSKVSQDEFRPWGLRVEALESGETPLGKVLLGQFTQLQSQVSELLLHGSQNAQAAGRRVGALETDVASLSTAQAAQEKLIDDRRSRDASSYRWRTLALTAFIGAPGVVALIHQFS